MDYSPDQVKAINTCIKEIRAGKPEIILAGAAGTGKTTVTKKLITECGKKTVLLAPTGKAAVRLNEATHRPTNTIHSALYGGVVETHDGKLVWEDPGPVCKPGELVVVDEFSMIGLSLYLDLMENIPVGASVLFIGDPFQLPPVNEDPGVDYKNPTAMLSEVHRQAADNPVLQLATATRQGTWIDWLANYDNTHPFLRKGYGFNRLVDTATPLFANDEDAVILCYTNASKDRFNNAIRAKLGREKPIEVGDKIIVRMNNKRVGVMNGEVYTVEKLRYYTSVKYGKYVIVHFEGRKTPFKIKLSLFSKSRNDYFRWAVSEKGLPKNFIHADYAYAITVHSSQGSEYKHVFYWWEDAQSRLYFVDKATCESMAYTGFTRSYQNLHVYREP